MIQCTTLYRNGGHRWLVFGGDASRPGNIVDTNQYVVQMDGEAVLMDPGGTEIFPAMLSAVGDALPVESIRHLFLSHQDPDVGSSLPLWREVCRPDLHVHVWALWTSFVSHFDGDAQFQALPDGGTTIRLGGLPLAVVPAHFLHSPGNFHLYDERARILFSADVGASLVPPEARQGMFVENFADHVRYMEGWHRRAMGSERARDAWLARVAKLEVEVLAPQHGLILKGDDVQRFYDWFARLKIGEGIEV